MLINGLVFAGQMLFVDSREPESIIQLLKSRLSVSVIKLDPADYVVGNVGIERKTVGDFLASLASGRLYEQLGRLRRAYQRPFLLVEGLLDWSVLSNPHWFCSALQNVVLADIPVIFSYSVENSAQVIERLARCVVAPISITTIQKSITDEQVPVNVLCAFPGIGKKKAEMLIGRFGTLNAVFCATKAELRSAGVGRKSARTIRSVLVTEKK